MRSKILKPRFILAKYFLWALEIFPKPFNQKQFPF